jgi:hypothetical protein
MGTREEINSLDLTRFFEHMSLSYEVGVRKPDKRIYLDALNALAIKGQECIFIADSARVTSNAGDILLFGEKVYNNDIRRGVGLGSRKRVQNSDDLFQSSRVPDKQELGIPRKG